jgi:hypothetical protein
LLKSFTVKWWISKAPFRNAEKFARNYRRYAPDPS